MHLSFIFRKVEAGVCQKRRTVLVQKSIKNKSIRFGSNYAIIIQIMAFGCRNKYIIVFIIPNEIIVAKKKQKYLREHVLLKKQKCFNEASDHLSYLCIVPSCFGTKHKRFESSGTIFSASQKMRMFQKSLTILHCRWTKNCCFNDLHT